MLLALRRGRRTRRRKRRAHALVNKNYTVSRTQRRSMVYQKKHTIMLGWVVK
jgi:hypothetical protein